MHSPYGQLLSLSLILQILHISDVEVRETKMMGDSPIIILAVSIFPNFLMSGPMHLMEGLSA